MANKKLIINSNIDIKQKAVGLIMCTANDISANMNRILKPVNLSLIQLHILHTLSHSPKGILTVNQIKSYMVDESPNVSRSLNKLMDKGYINKNRDLKDQRIVYIEITDSGRDIHDEADGLLLKESIDLSDEDAEKLVEILSLM
jgi:MarR family transcriptional regulator